MSSTNRGGKREVSDYYKTPVRSILDFIMEFDNDNPTLSFTGGDKVILDPCAGGKVDEGGRLMEGMSYPEALAKFKPLEDGKNIIALDIRKDSPAGMHGDYLLDQANRKVADVIITNPPFCFALQIINKALADVRPGGLVIMLLRLNFFGSQERSAWFQEHMPIYCYVHSRRMKFTKSKSTDSIEYMHAVWQKDNYPKFTKLRII
jgi:hypothetical protein